MINRRDKISVSVLIPAEDEYLRNRQINRDEKGFERYVDRHNIDLSFEDLREEFQIGLKLTELRDPDAPMALEYRADIER